MEAQPRPETANGSTASSEIFVIIDFKTRRPIPVRELTDKELSNYAADVHNQYEQAKQNLSVAIGAFDQVARGHGTLQYEIDRRARTLVIATGLPRNS